MQYDKGQTGGPFQTVPYLKGHCGKQQIVIYMLMRENIGGIVVSCHIKYRWVHRHETFLFGGRGTSISQ